MDKGKGLYPGCLAQVVNCIQTPENNGAVVRVVRYVRPGDITPMGEAAQYGWGVHTEGRVLVGYRYYRSTGKVAMRFETNERPFAAKCLLPLGGPELVVDTDTAKPKEVPTKEDVF